MDDEADIAGMSLVGMSSHHDDLAEGLNVAHVYFKTDVDSRRYCTPMHGHYNTYDSE